MEEHERLTTSALAIRDLWARYQRVVEQAVDLGVIARSEADRMLSASAHRLTGVTR
jgi:hypothetical protein